MSASDCFLTRALVSPGTIQARGIRDAYHWHQVIWQAFPERDGEPRDFLTRLDDQQGGMQVLIVSPQAPVRPPWLGPQDSWATKSVSPSFFQARRYRFQLRANVTKKEREPGATGQLRSTGKRVAISRREDILRWLHRKGELGGFAVPDEDAVELKIGVQRFAKAGSNRHQQSGTHGVVDFTGSLEVTDPDLFYATFVKGLGSAKAFGFGLLVLAPAL